jgi:RHS repeat-associated protein
MLALAPKRPTSTSPPPFAPAGGLNTFVTGNYLDEVWNALESDGPEMYTNYYFLTGVNYSVMGVIDAYNSNVMAEAYEYDPYGRHRVIDPGIDATYFTSDDTYDELHPGAISNSIRYTGQRFDAESGLMYYKNRYNDPAAGRFIGRDPLGWSEGPNRYGYVGGRPQRYLDPFGFNECCEGPGLSGFDHYGWEWAWHWYAGSGEMLEYYFDPHLSDYMRANSKIQSRLDEETKYFGERFATLPDGTYYFDTGDKHLELQNGYFLGYELLHGTFFFRVQGSAKKQGKRIDFSYVLTWKDEMNSERETYDLDGVYEDNISNVKHAGRTTYCTFFGLVGAGAIEVFAPGLARPPKAYDIRIMWTDSRAYEIDEPSIPEEEPIIQPKGKRSRRNGGRR